MGDTETISQIQKLYKSLPNCGLRRHMENWFEYRPGDKYAIPDKKEVGERMYSKEEMIKFRNETMPFSQSVFYRTNSTSTTTDEQLIDKWFQNR